MTFGGKRSGAAAIIEVSIQKVLTWAAYLLWKGQNVDAAPFKTPVVANLMPMRRSSRSNERMEVYTGISFRALARHHILVSARENGPEGPSLFT